MEWFEDGWCGEGEKVMKMRGGIAIDAKVWGGGVGLAVPLIVDRRLLENYSVENSELRVERGKWVWVGIP